MSHGTSARVLVVEDDPEFRAALEDMLAGSGHEVVVANNGADAIALLEGGERPNAVLVDLLMPGVVGQELLEYLRSSDELAHIPVAIVSASPQLAPEGYTVFSKPLEPGPLLDFVRDLNVPPAA
jgi:CheY-like chemotaxis protein